MIQRGANYARVVNDHYPTPPEVTQALLDNFKFNRQVCDPACGTERKIVNVLNDNGYRTYADDLTMGQEFTNELLFFAKDFGHKRCDIITNPPFGKRGYTAVRFIERALEITNPWRGKVAMLLPADFDSAKTRAHIFRDQPAFAAKLILLDRIRWFDNKAGSVNFAWYCWCWQHKGSPVIKYSTLHRS